MGRLAFCLLPFAFCLAAGGCTWDELNPWHKDDPAPSVARESLILGPNGLSPAQLTMIESNPDLVAAKEVVRQGDYDKAEKLFHRIAEKATKDDPLIAEDARFNEAECLRMQGRYPKAADTYIKMLNDFGGRVRHTDEAVEQLFNIANYWLDDTRKEIEETKEKTDGKRWFVAPHFLHPMDKSKPFFDEEGRAIEALEHVCYSAIRGGKYADKARYMIGTVKFFNEDFREADFQFTEIVERYKDSPYYAQTAEMAILSKNLSTGGSDYDGRKCAEARKMYPIAQTSYRAMESKDPKEAQEKEAQLAHIMAGVTMQQAEKDYKMAEFYRHRDRLESAYFMYEIVRRRYPATSYADMAMAQMQKIRDKVAKDNKGKLPMPEATPLQPDGSIFYQQLPGAPQPAPSAQPAPAPQMGQPQPLPPSLQR